MEMTNPAVICSAVKMAETGSGWVLRLFNSTGESQDSSIRWGEKTAVVSLTPWEVKTLLWQNDAATPTETNLLEQPLSFC